jgi:hypothetical protein
LGILEKLDVDKPKRLGYNNSGGTNVRPRKVLINYYKDGWRFGYLVKRGYKWTRIRRILPAGSSQRPFITVLTADTRPVEGGRLAEQANFMLTNPSRKHLIR